MMNSSAWRRHRLLNAVQSLLLVAAMALILGALGWIVAGATGVVWALVGGIALVLLNPGVSPRLILRLYGTRRLGRAHAPQLLAIVAQLSARAGLPAAPELHYVPSQMLNAFSVGTRSHSAVAITDGLLHALGPREIVGVLAHEISHVRHNDMWVMGLADLFSRMTSFFSAFGQILLIVNLPLVLFSDYAVSWTAIVILVLAPTLSALIQLALSRTREFDADLGAAELTGDPRGLALALERMERYQGRFLEQIFLPGRRVPEPSLLRTHPATEERIRRLLELEPDSERPGLPGMAAMPRLARDRYPAAGRPPRWHLHGLWY